MFGEHVDLDVNAIAGLAVSQGRHGERVGNEHDREGVVPDIDERQADPVHSDRAFGDKQWGPDRLDVEAEEFPFSLVPAIAEFRSRVDMSLNEVSSQPATHLDRTLEIDAIAGLSKSQVGSIERFWPGLDLKSRRLVATTVRQQPLTATLSPSSSGSPAERSGHEIVNRLAPLSVTMRSSRPNPSISPVNTSTVSLMAVSTGRWNMFSRSCLT